MTEPEQPLDLERLQELYDAATGGNWTLVRQIDQNTGDADRNNSWWVGFDRDSTNHFYDHDSTLMGKNDAEFIAEAHNAFPQLLAATKKTVDLEATCIRQHRELIQYEHCPQVLYGAEALAMLKRLEISGEWEGSHEGRELAALIKKLEVKDG